MPSDEPSDEAPVCAECGNDFYWNENADRDNPNPFCNQCAHVVAGRAATLQRELDGARAELAEVRIAADLRHAARFLSAQQTQSPQPDPEREARRRLGEWLAAAPRRTWCDYPPDPTCSGRFAEMWTVKLIERGTDVGIANAKDRTKALRHALDAAGAASQSPQADTEGG